MTNEMYENLVRMISERMISERIKFWDSRLNQERVRSSKRDEIKGWLCAYESCLDMIMYAHNNDYDCLSAFDVYHNEDA